MRVGRATVTPKARRVTVKQTQAKYHEGVSKVINFQTTPATPGNTWPMINFLTELVTRQPEALYTTHYKTLIHLHCHQLDTHVQTKS